jgi:hypothetical protein
MFELFGKKKAVTAMDQLIVAIYGDPPPKKRANLTAAIKLADEDLLCGLVEIELVTQHATELNNGPIPYSTHDLALSVALAFFKDTNNIKILNDAQMLARLSALSWLDEGKVAPLLVQSFENTLYMLYKPI